jgi:hypothetical protein
MQLTYLSTDSRSWKPGVSCIPDGFLLLPSFLSVFWQSKSTKVRKILKGALLEPSLAFSCLWKWVNYERCSDHFLYMYMCVCVCVCVCVSRRMMSWLWDYLRMCPAFISIPSFLSPLPPPPFLCPSSPPPLLNLKWKWRSSLIAIVAQDFWLTERLFQKHYHTQHTGKEPPVPFFIHFSLMSPLQEFVILILCYMKSIISIYLSKFSRIKSVIP